jgi:hypothetical protein
MVRSNPIWGSNPDIISPGGVGAVLGTPVKMALVLGGGIVASTLLLGAKQYLSQKQVQQAVATAPTEYKFYQVPGGGSQVVNNPSGGTATTSQKENQTATQSQPDYMQMLLIGALAIGGIFLLSKGGKK